MRTLALGVWIGLWSLATPSVADMSGPDDRIPFDKTEDRLRRKLERSVFRIETKRGFCTGFAVTPTLALSAGHCPYEAEPRALYRLEGMSSDLEVPLVPLLSVLVDGLDLAIYRKKDGSFSDYLPVDFSGDEIPKDQCALAAAGWTWNTSGHRFNGREPHLFCWLWDKLVGSKPDSIASKAQVSRIDEVARVSERNYAPPRSSIWSVPRFIRFGRKGVRSEVPRSRFEARDAFAQKKTLLSFPSDIVPGNSGGPVWRLTPGSCASPAHVVGILIRTLVKPESNEAIHNSSAIDLSAVSQTLAALSPDLGREFGLSGQIGAIEKTNFRNAPEAPRIAGHIIGDLKGVQLKDVDFDNIDFQVDWGECLLENVRFVRSRLFGNDFSRCRLKNVSFPYSTLLDNQFPAGFQPNGMEVRHHE